MDELVSVPPKRPGGLFRDNIVRPPSRLISPEKLPKLLKLVGVHRYDLYTWYTSWCLPVFNLFLFRLFCAVYLAIALTLGFWYGSHENGVQFFFFFTYISTFLLCCYFVLHAWHTFRVLRFSSEYFKRQASKASPWYLWLLQFLYSGCFVFHVIVVVIYWTILYPAVLEAVREKGLVLGPLAVFLDISVHIVPMAFMLAEIAVNNRFNVYAVEIFQTLAFMALYMLWMWMGAFVFFLARKQAWWVYPHFNFTEKSGSFQYYVIIFVLTVSGFFLMWGLHRMKTLCSGCIPPDPSSEEDEIENQYKNIHSI